MQNKLLLKDLAQYLACESGLSETAAEEFVHLFFSSIENGITKDGQVKIKGFGTFKLIEVSDRTSIDVTTGKRITIGGYNKLTFVPETSLKNTINKPFADFDIVPLSETYDTSSDVIVEQLTPTTEDEEDNDYDNEVSTTQESDNILSEDNKNATSEVDKPLSEIGKGDMTDPLLSLNSISSVNNSDELPDIDNENNAKIDVLEGESNTSGLIKEQAPTNKSSYLSLTEKDQAPTQDSRESKPQTALKKNVTYITSESALKENENDDDNEYEFEDYEPSSRLRFTWHMWLPLLLILLFLIGLYFFINWDGMIREPSTPRFNNSDIVHAESMDIGLNTNQTNPYLVPEEYLLNDSDESNNKSIAIDSISIDVKASFIDTTETTVCNIDEKSPQEIADESNETKMPSMATNLDVYQKGNVDFEKTDTNNSLNAEGQATNEKKVSESNRNEVKINRNEESEVKSNSISKSTSIQKDNSSSSDNPHKPYRLRMTADDKQKALQNITIADTVNYDIQGMLTTHTLKSGETLTSVALHYYGDKRLWPYIVKYNDLKNHNSLAIGQKLKIPYLKNKE